MLKLQQLLEGQNLLLEDVEEGLTSFDFEKVNSSRRKVDLDLEESFSWVYHLKIL